VRHLTAAYNPPAVQPVRFQIDPFANDPGAWSASLVNNAELLIGALDASGARSVGEVGAYAGDLTGLLLDWAAETGARVFAIDPSPQPELEQLAAARSDLELVRETSLEAFKTIELPDSIIIDGDHNYYTVSEELRLVAERAGEDLPLLLFHDVCWPHGRRDDYFRPEQIPEAYRQPTAPEGGLYPGIEGVRFGGLPYHWPAAREGGPRNGVLTAVEDFVADREDVRLAVIPAFFGLGVVWRLDAPYAAALAELLDPWDGNPILERLERNRVLHLASSHVQLRMAEQAQAKVARLEGLLRKMLDSRAFALAEGYTRLRERGSPAFSREEIRRALASD
jgi:Methyltransferase domain